MKLHNKEFVVDFLLIRLNDDHYMTDEYEEIISEDFIHYIDDKRHLSLPISVLDRIATKYVLKNRTSIESNEDEAEQNEDEKIHRFLISMP